MTRAEYTAAVIEFYPEQNRSLAPDERLKRNVDGYLDVLEQIANDNVLDIVIFPESTLATNAIITHHKDYIPFTVEVAVNQSLCVAENTTFLTRLACAAKTYNTYLVVNLYERTPNNLTEDGWDFYNTNVVLDRSGTVVSRYRKYNLFGEMFMNKTAQPEISILDTDFGIRFGTFICFDILFKKPSLDLIRKHNVTHILYSAMWFSELPFLTSLQTQLQWAYAVNATFLSSGANNPKVGSGGSGLFQGTEGAVAYDILGQAGSKAFVAKLPAKKFAVEEDVDKKAKEMDGFRTRPENLTGYTSKTIEFGRKEVNETVCHRDFCCNFTIEIEWNKELLQNYYVYHMVAYDGVRSFYVYNGGIQICGVIACQNQSLDSCGKRFPNYDEVSWPSTFTRIEIRGKFEISDDKIQHPNSLLSNIKPLPVDAIEWTGVVINSTIVRTYVLKKSQNRLMTFAIFGRDFSRDSPPTPNNSDIYNLKLIILITLIALNYYL
ncbi:hypothetical protein FQR65_LT13312 [Abscondita terminalis]|nr:hypothetical protein FQR65_LT13312 [Abscondita terminalis]